MARHNGKPQTILISDEVDSASIDQRLDHANEYQLNCIPLIVSFNIIATTGFMTMARLTAPLATRFSLHSIFSSIAILFLAASFSSAQSAEAQMPGQNFPGLAPISAEQSEHGIHATMGSEVLDVVVCTDSVIHVVAKANAEVELSKKPWMLDADQSYCSGQSHPFHGRTKVIDWRHEPFRHFFSYRSAAAQFC